MYFVFKSNYINYLKSGKLNNNKERNANQISGPGTGLCRDEPGPSLPQGFPRGGTPVPAGSPERSTHCEHWNTQLLPQGSLISTCWVFGSAHTLALLHLAWASGAGLSLGTRPLPWAERDSEGVCRACMHGLLKIKATSAGRSPGPEPLRTPRPSWPVQSLPWAPSLP